MASRKRRAPEQGTENPIKKAKVVKVRITISVVRVIYRQTKLTQIQKAPAPKPTDIEAQAKNLELDIVKLQLEGMRHLIGKFRIAASNLDFHWNGADNTEQRPLDLAHVRALQQQFAEAGLRRILPDHHIDAIVSRKAYEDAVKMTTDLTGVDPSRVKPKPLGENDPEWNIQGIDSTHTDLDGLTALDRTLNKLFGYPRLVFPAGVTLEAQSGQHRIHAIRSMFANERDKWWVVNLYSDNISAAAKESLRSNISHLHRLPTLAEGWLNFIHYKNSGDRISMLRAISSKQQKVSQLASNLGYHDAITNILKFKAFWPEFAPGLLSRMLPLRCVDESLRYLRRIKLIWDYIGGDIPYFGDLVDPHTAKLLAGLAPARFADDAHLVGFGMDNSELFFKITDKERRAGIKQRLLSIDYRILTLQTFHDDTKSLQYFAKIMGEVAAWCFGDFVAPPVLTKEEKAAVVAAKKKKGTIEDHTPISIATAIRVKGFQPLKIYRSQLYPQYYLEGDELVKYPTGDGSHRLSDKVYANFGYRQIWIFVFRNFFQLVRIYPAHRDLHQVTPFEWVEKELPPLTEAKMKDEFKICYNNRFSVSVWRQLWRIVQGFGFHTENADLLGIGPKYHKMAKNTLQLGPVELADEFDIFHLKIALHKIRPSVTAEVEDQYLKEICALLPPRTEAETGIFGDICPRTCTQQTRSGMVREVWIPGFQRSCAKITLRNIFSAGSSGAKTAIEDDEQFTDLEFFVKRDFIFSLFSPIESAAPMFGPRQTQWPPQGPDNGFDSAGLEVCDTEDDIGIEAGFILGLDSLQSASGGVARGTSTQSHRKKRSDSGGLRGESEGRRPIHRARESVGEQAGCQKNVASSPGTPHSYSASGVSNLNIGMTTDDDCIVADRAPARPSPADIKGGEFVAGGNDRRACPQIDIAHSPGREDTHCQGSDSPMCMGESGSAGDGVGLPSPGGHPGMDEENEYGDDIGELLEPAIFLYQANQLVKETDSFIAAFEEKNQELCDSTMMPGRETSNLTCVQ